jgi:hypothetical protein
MLLLLIQTRIINICFKQPIINPLLKNQNFLFQRIFRTSWNKIILKKIILIHLIKKFSILNDLECSLPCSQELATRLFIMISKCSSPNVHLTLFFYLRLSPQRLTGTKMQMYWNVASCRLLGIYRRFGGVTPLGNYLPLENVLTSQQTGLFLRIAVGIYLALFMFHCRQKYLKTFLCFSHMCPPTLVLLDLTNLIMVDERYSMLNS